MAVLEWSPRWRAPFLTIALAAAGAAYAAPPTAARPLNARVTLQGKGVERTVGAKGGTLTLRTGDRTRITLAIPSHALTAPTKVRMRLIRGFAGTPLTRIVAAVDLEPNGLMLLTPATLTFRPGHAVPVFRQVPFAALGRGRQVHLFPPERERRWLVLRTMHLSEYGMAEDRSARRPPARAACYGELCADLGPQAKKIASHPPADTGAKSEADLGSVLEYGRANDVPLDSPEMVEAIARAFLPVYTKAAELLMAYLNHPTAEGYRAAIQPALTMDRWLQLLGYGHSLTWTPPPTSDPALRDKLIFFQQLLSKGVPLALDYGYKDARDRCINGHEKAMAPILMRNSYDQYYLFGKDMLDQARSDAGRCGTCKLPQYDAWVSPAGIPRPVRPQDRARPGERQMCWPPMRFEGTIQAHQAIYEEPSPGSSDRFTAYSVATGTWKLEDAHLLEGKYAAGTIEATYVLTGATVTWSLSSTDIHFHPDIPGTLEDESYTETCMADGSGTVPLLPDPPHLYLRFDGGARYGTGIRPDYATATYTQHCTSTANGGSQPSEYPSTFNWREPVSLDATGLLTGDTAFGRTLVGRRTTPATTVEWRLDAAD